MIFSADRVSFQAFANDKLFASTANGNEPAAEMRRMNSEVIFSATIVDKVISNAEENFVTLLFAINTVR